MQWITENEQLIYWASALSIITLLTTMLVGPLVLVKIPADYFRRYRDAERASKWTPGRILVLLLRNTVGVVLLVVGLVLLVLPGQGVLTILAGLMFLSLRAKRRLLRRVVHRPSVRRSIDWLRRRAGKSPLVMDPQDELERASTKKRDAVDSNSPNKTPPGAE